VGNAAKCLKAGIGHVAMICADATKLGKIQKAVLGCVSGEDAARVGFYAPDQFIAYLKVQKPSEPSVPAPQEVALGKYKITRRASKLTAEETREREAAAHKLLAQTMRHKS
jgi:hypothetical protein